MAWTVPARAVVWACRRFGAIVFQEGVGAAVRKCGTKIHSAFQGRSAWTPFTTRDLDAQYATWLHLYRYSSEDLSVLRASLDRSGFLPHIRVVVVITPEKAPTVPKSLTSLQQQMYSAWDLLVICHPSCRAVVEKAISDQLQLQERVRMVCSQPEVAEKALSGEYVLVVSADAELAPEALLSLVAALNEDQRIDMLYGDEDRIDGAGRRVAPYFKPGWSPDLLRATNYIGPLVMVQKELLTSVPEYATMLWEGDLSSIALRLGERARRIVRVPQVLCHVHEGSSDRNVGSGDCDDRHNRTPAACSITEGAHAARASDLPMVSIVVPTRDQGQLLQRCMDSIERTSHGLRYELIIVDNGTTESATRQYLEDMSHAHQVLHCPGPFNFSALNNHAIGRASGEYILFLNNDVEAMQQGWLEAMLTHAQRPGVGAVGAKLLYPDGSVQHAGVVLGVAGVAGHAFRHTPAKGPSYHGFVDLVRNCSAVTAACMLVPKKVFQEVGGFDERLAVEYNDVDLCLRIREQGYRIVYTPKAVLYHYENATRCGTRNPEDETLFCRKWDALLKEGDPYYHPHLTRKREDWSLDI